MATQGSGTRLMGSCCSLRHQACAEAHLDSKAAGALWPPPRPIHWVHWPGFCVLPAPVPGRCAEARVGLPAGPPLLVLFYHVDSGAWSGLPHAQLVSLLLSALRAPGRPSPSAASCSGCWSCEEGQGATGTSLCRSSCLGRSSGAGGGTQKWWGPRPSSLVAGPTGVYQTAPCQLAILPV